MADNEQELEEIIGGTEKELKADDDLLLRVGRGHWEDVVPIILAKLKAMGYKSPEEVKGLVKGIMDVYEEDGALVKWDREKVAELCFSCNYLTSSTSWSEAKKAETERAYEQADQLHKELTGGN